MTPEFGEGQGEAFFQFQRGWARRQRYGTTTEIAAHEPAADAKRFDSSPASHAMNMSRFFVFMICRPQQRHATPAAPPPTPPTMARCFIVASSVRKARSRRSR